jgi:hypothetical protein
MGETSDQERCKFLNTSKLCRVSGSFFKGNWPQSGVQYYSHTYQWFSVSYVAESARVQPLYLCHISISRVSALDAAEYLE